VVDRYAYDSWGEPVSDDRPNEMVPQQLRYRGYYYDEALTYYWVDGRYDDPEAMRWLQPSAPNADDYAYARDNPIGANSQRGGPEPRVSASGAFPNFMGFVDLCPYFEAGPGEIVYSPFDPTDIPDAGGVRVVARRALGLCATFTLATLRPVPNVVSASGPNGVPILYNCEPKKPLQRFRPIMRKKVRVRRRRTSEDNEGATVDQPYAITLEEAPDPRDIQAVEGGLSAYNRARVGADDYRRFALFLRAPDRAVVGGLLGDLYWGWLHVDILWVAEPLRRQGHGQALLAAAEQEAVRRGCRYAHLDTMGFQARPFYERHGYTLFGALHDIPAGSGHSRYFMRKTLAD